jgi:hypothetical protein
MILTIDVLVVDVLELDVFGARLKNHIKTALAAKKETITWIKVYNLL